MLAHGDRTGNNARVDNHDRVDLRSGDGRVVVHVDHEHGGRIADIVVDGVSLLVGADDNGAHHPLGWGCYPMVPYCGRVRDARLIFRDREHQLPRSAEPHSIHGTLFDVPWRVLSRDTSSVDMRAELDPPWPFRGRVTHQISVDSTSVTMRVLLDADDDMPAMIGWHPWFRKPERSPDQLRSMLRRDPAGIATSEIVERRPGTVDDCFLAPDDSLTMRVEGVSLRLSSDCSHWVVYDEPTHATCVEPQSGPPNQINDRPVVVGGGEQMSRWFRIEVTPS